MDPSDPDQLLGKRFFFLEKGQGWLGRDLEVADVINSPLIALTFPTLSSPAHVVYP